MSIILDGTGSGSRAAVTSTNRLKTDGVFEDSYTYAAGQGLAFNINTDPLVYTGTAPWSQGALYVMNNEVTEIEMVGWFIGEKNNRSGGVTTEPLLFGIYGNPTLVVGGATVPILNRKVGAARQFDIEAKSQPTSYSTTGAAILSQYHYSSRGFGYVNFTIPPGQSIMVQIESESDSFTAYTGFTGYVKGS